MLLLLLILAAIVAVAAGIGIVQANPTVDVGAVLRLRSHTTAVQHWIVIVENNDHRHQDVEQRGGVCAALETIEANGPVGRDDGVVWPDGLRRREQQRNLGGAGGKGWGEEDADPHTCRSCIGVAAAVPLVGNSTAVALNAVLDGQHQALALAALYLGPHRPVSCEVVSIGREVLQSVLDDLPRAVGPVDRAEVR